MRCFRCDHDNPDAAPACGACGAALDALTPCPACGFPNPTAQMRCSGCGGERRPRAASPVMRERLPVGPDVDRYPPAAEVADVDALRRGYDKLRAAYATARAMSVDGGLDALLAQIVETAIEVLGADRAAVMLLDSSDGAPTVRAAKQRGGAAADVQPSRTIVREVIEGRVGIISADAGSDDRFQAAASIRLGDVRSAMCVPMLQDGNVLGVLHCDTRLTTGAFERTDLAVLTAIASQAAVAVHNALLIDRIREETERRVQLERFFSPAVVEQIVQSRLDVGSGELTSLVVFFLDIRGFTRLSEGMSPTAIVEILNAFFEEMVEVLFAHDGTLDKYVGDQLMALFGAPTPLADAPLAAVRCASAMQRRLEDFNVRGRSLGRPPLAVGIGIHLGRAVCGVVGSSRAGQYTAMGDTVNTAARLCDHARAGQIVISAPVYEAVRDRVDAAPLPPAVLKGKDRPVQVFAVQQVP
jgi:adenylate cyclase